MVEKLSLQAADGATAALFSVAALATTLNRKGVLSSDDLNETFAVAASMCRANGSEDGAKAIEAMVPSSEGIDVAALARARGDEVTQR